MRLTGWTEAVLRAQPARVIRAHFWRVFSGHVWEPSYREMATAPVSRAAYGDLSGYLKAVEGRDAAVSLLKTIEGLLWPEDDDG